MTGWSIASFHCAHIRDDFIDRHHVVIPIYQCFIADVDRYDKIIKFLCKFYRALYLGRIFQGIRRQRRRRYRLIQPGTTLVVAELGREPRTQHHFDRELMLSDQFEG